MAKQEDREYYVGRARDERERARMSTDPCVKARHLELAEQYELRIEAMEYPVLRMASGRA